MSKKSRKRNKRLLALAGLAGAVALSNRKKKSDLASTEDGKSGSTKITGGTNLNDYDGGTTKPIAKPDTTPKDTQPKGSNVRTRGKIVDSSGDTVASAGTAIADNKSKVTNVTKPGDNMYSTNAGSSNPRRVNRKDGGRMGLKSGGRAKGCGKALRGFGKAMKGNR